MNYMKQVAQMLGVEIGEIFYIKNRYKYRLTEKSIEFYDAIDQKWTICPYRIQVLLNGEDEIIKNILDDIEKRYLSNVIKPFRDRVIDIIKRDDDIYEYIVIESRGINGEEEYMYFPFFKKGTMYKGMKLDKKYNLKELGL